MVPVPAGPLAAPGGPGPGLGHCRPPAARAWVRAGRGTALRPPAGVAGPSGWRQLPRGRTGNTLTLKPGPGTPWPPSSATPPPTTIDPGPGVQGPRLRLSLAAVELPQTSSPRPTGPANCPPTLIFDHPTPLAAVAPIPPHRKPATTSQKGRLARLRKSCRRSRAPVWPPGGERRATRLRRIRAAPALFSRKPAVVNSRPGVTSYCGDAETEPDDDLDRVSDELDRVSGRSLSAEGDPEELSRGEFVVVRELQAAQP